MKAIRLLVILSICWILGFSCKQEVSQATIDGWKKEITKAEMDFAAMVASDGMEKGFLHFAAEDAVLSRDQNLVIGKSAIEERLKQSIPPGLDMSLEWSPEYVDVSRSGDMGYTYGYYLLSVMDSVGVKNESKGVFHTVWKRQADGSWKYVWD